MALGCAFFTFKIERGMNKMNKKFFKAMAIRTVKTICETALAMIPAMVTIQEVDWLTVLSTSALSGVICILTCIKGLPEVEE